MTNIDRTSNQEELDLGIGICASDAMNPDEHDVCRHYDSADLGERILEVLRSTGADMTTLSVEDLAVIDALHIRGRSATIELAARLDLRSTHRVLDIGCGLGGTCRYLASASGCTAVGIDLTKAYCDAAELLSSLTGLCERTSFHHGSALSLPFEDASFDVCWTEHAQMNIAEKRRFYEEINRVLRPGGHFAFHDIFSHDGAAIDLPVPWADQSSISFLATVDSIRGLLDALGFRVAFWEDQSPMALAFVEEVIGQIREAPNSASGLRLFMGESASTKLENLQRNLETGRIRVVQAVMRRPFR